MTHVCIVPGCGLFDPCPRHGQAMRRGRTRQSRKVRALVLARDRNRCVDCGAEATTVDHRLPIIEGGPDDERNMGAQCIACKERKHARPITLPIASG